MVIIAVVFGYSMSSGQVVALIAKNICIPYTAWEEGHNDSLCSVNLLYKVHT